jgi:predicted alpha/beta superfamily hydrolase
VDVWLPPGYDADTRARYPVVYMQDGQNLFDASTSYGGVSWSADKAMVRLIASGRTRGALIVGIWNTLGNRAAEYMPQKASGLRDSKDLPGLPGSESHPISSDAYLKFLVTELKPYIDTLYRTEPGRPHTFVMGSSMGGLISAYAMAEYPDVFGGAGCISTHWPAGNGVVIDYLAKHLPSPGDHKFYFDHGTATLDAQYGPYQERMDAVLRAGGYTPGTDWISRVFPGAEHSERSWRERVEIPLAFFLATDAPPRD